MVHMEQGKSILGEAAGKLGITRKPSPGEGQAVANEAQNSDAAKEETQTGTVLKNRAAESRSPYVRGHMNNPVAWQLWGDEAIELAKKENKLLFVSIGYSACHWCHVMEKESFENNEIASILNKDFIPIKIDREERPDIDRIYMNFVQATTGSGGWPLNVFVTPNLEPVFGGTYWPGPTSNTPQLPLEEQVDFLGILKKLATVWKEQEARCRQDSAQILQQLKDFAAEGTLGLSRLGTGDETTLDLELVDEAYQHLVSTFDTINSGFGAAPKFPTPSKLAFLLRLPNFPQPVIDIVGADETKTGQLMALSTLRAMARGGIHDHIGHGFARYSVTADWSLPHFEKMLYDNAQLLHVYLDGFLGLDKPDAELLGVVYDLVKYLTSAPVAAKDGGFYSSEDADSYYRKGDAEKREGAYYVWTRRELDQLLDQPAAEIVSAFFGVSQHGNVGPEHDVHDEFINQNVLKISRTPTQLASQFGIDEKEVVDIIKDSKKKLRAHREAERVRPTLDDKIVCSWNGLAIGALARTGASLLTIDDSMAQLCFDSAEKAANFIKREMYDANTKTLKRVWREGPGDTAAFSDDYAFLIEGLIDLYEATFDDSWLKWADELQATQIHEFLDTRSGGFFATAASAEHTILRLKDAMDNAEPSTNGISATNLFRLASLLDDENYEKIARGTLSAFEAEIMQYPWLFGSFMPVIVAAAVGVKGIVRVGPEANAAQPPSAVVSELMDVAIAPDAPITNTEGVVVADTVMDAEPLEKGEAVDEVKKAVMKDVASEPSAEGKVVEEGEAIIVPAVVETTPVTMEMTELGGIVEAGEAKHPEKKAATKTPKRNPNPRGALQTSNYVDESHGAWLRERNKLLAELKPRSDGQERVLVCEGRVCREVDEAEL